MTGRYLIYRRANECERFPFEAIPRRVFLDTNVVNILVKWGEQVFEEATVPEHVDATLSLDIEALTHVFYVGKRAQWDVVVSTKTMDELACTSDEKQRRALLDYGAQLIAYQNGNGYYKNERSYAADFARAA